MIKQSVLILLGLLVSIVCYSQPDPLIVPSYLNLGPDSAQNKQLISSINSFLQQTVKPAKENTYVLKENLPETAVLIDEIKGMENGKGPNNKNVYKCYLNSIMLLDSTDFLVQLSYMKIEESTPIVRLSFKLLAKKIDGQFYFSSPLKRNTAAWKVKKVGDFTLYYKTTLQTDAVNNYVKKAHEFDKKLQAPAYTTIIYYCDDLEEELQLIGIDYKLDYNGFSYGGFSDFEEGIDLDVTCETSHNPFPFEIHDLWHDRLHHTVARSTINKPVDEACAYLYGGSWNISWNDIFKKFKVYMGTNKDWLTAFTDNKNFGDTQLAHLYVSYVIDALLVQKIEKEKGFQGVLELLTCGKKQLDDANYFAALNKITGINKSNFNAEVEKLVEAEPVK
ncbi:hypothetical protein HDF24_24575 [Mucilaginibacter sp. X4EP1]|uniref:hypothetical protein n=1 Tax=Mucilaginibacter sp. X4EP1 TaxID=2723092 RepID=UPI002169B7F4|nr:hypothetical protein [Mucilaginibacter sp. X4EP1]MCS3815219.1 hypothetical protein [Mucilaginibacter sp. X4EP1]